MPQHAQEYCLNINNICLVTKHVPLRMMLTEQSCLRVKGKLFTQMDGFMEEDSRGLENHDGSSYVPTWCPQIQIKELPDNLPLPSPPHLPYILKHAVVEILPFTCKVKLGVRLMCEWMVYFRERITSKIYSRFRSLRAVFIASDKLLL